jgi:hypothetical protein
VHDDAFLVTQESCQAVPPLPSEEMDPKRESLPPLAALTDQKDNQSPKVFIIHF